MVSLKVIRRYFLSQLFSNECAKAVGFAHVTLMPKDAYEIRVAYEGSYRQRGELQGCNS